MSAEVQFDAERNITLLGGSRIVFHCHHYNLFLQRTIDDALGADAVEVQRAAAAESARRVLGALLGGNGKEPVRARLEKAGALFGKLGFGLADITALDAEGGQVRLVTSHYALGWREKFGPATDPVCHFAAGFWAAALGVSAGLSSERILVRETSCAAVTEQGACEIQVEVL
jgi:predicted hydrocarbon binding protein